MREREVQVHLAERKNESDLEEVRRWKRNHTPSRLVQVGPGGLTKEPDTTVLEPDPIDDPSEPMDLDPVAASPVSTGPRKSLRRVRV